MGKIIIPIQKYEEKVEEIPVDEVKTEEKTLLDIAEEPAIKLAPAVPGAPNNMIQKHVDNFLAKIAGETPVDDEVRDSTEYWLNKIAEAGGGGGTKFLHFVSFRFNIGENYHKCIATFVKNDNVEMTLSDIRHYLYDNGFVGGLAGGKFFKLYPTNGSVLGIGCASETTYNMYVGVINSTTSSWLVDTVVPSNIVMENYNIVAI